MARLCYSVDDPYDLKSVLAPEWFRKPSLRFVVPWDTPQHGQHDLLSCACIWLAVLERN
jgi:hypothetical protein